MIKKIVVLLLVVCTACQSTKIKNETYKIAISSPELGSIGQAEVKNVVENNFSIRTLPKIENKIRVSIDILPYNLKLNKIYSAKARYNQNQTKTAYIDSLPLKPELTTIKILDINGLVNELNANYNTDVFRLLKDTKKFQIITSLAVSLSKDEITKIRQADAYYLTNTQDKKYLISLYKSGKKTETIDINPETIIAYQASKFCWASNSKGQWYIADITMGKSNCNGNTKSNIPEGKKKNKSLFDM